MSINDVPQPPNPFKFTPNYTTLPKGTELHRIYSGDYSGNAFNPSAKVRNRFSPFWHRGGVVPVLYAASSRRVAIYETLFHDAHVKGARRKALPVKSLERFCGSFFTQRDLTLARLHAPDLAKFGLTMDQLTATNSVYYPQTARWAEALHGNFRGLHGLEWTSYRGAPGVAYVLFGDRVAPVDLLPCGNEVMMRTDVHAYEEVLECANAVGVRVSRPLLV